MDVEVFAGLGAGWECINTRVEAAISPKITHILGITKESNVKAESKNAIRPHELAILQYFQLSFVDNLR